MKKLFISFTLSLLILIINVGCNSNIEGKKQPEEGEMVSEFTVNGDSSSNEIRLKEKTEEETLLEQGWEKMSILNGGMPNCYNYTPRFGDVKNELLVTVGGGTDVVIKIMTENSDKCIRYVFINSGSTYSIANIPEGRYYLKIAYGHDWISKTSNGLCEGRFLSSALYERGEEILDFNKRITYEGYNIPSFSLKLDVISGSSENTFNSSGISEEDFNN